LAPDIAALFYGLGKIGTWVSYFGIIICLIVVIYNASLGGIIDSTKYLSFR